MKKILSLLFVFISLTVYAEIPEGIDFSIRFYDKTVYYANSQIFIKAEVSNNSPEAFRFRLAGSRVFNLDFEVRTISNTPMPHSQEFSILRNSNQPVFVREITLEPGEQYSFIEELSSFVDIDSSGVYVIRARFYPDLSTAGSEAVILSNPLNLSLRPEMTAQGVGISLDAATGDILSRSPLPPDEVVSYMISARQHSQWEKFFLYLDVEKIMLRDPEKARRFTRMSEDDRLRMVSDFRKELSSEKTDTDIVIIPSEFEILQTKYTPQEATVDVLEKFVYSTFTEKKRFTYYLRREERIWMIYNYEVRNLGTE